MKAKVSLRQMISLEMGCEEELQAHRLEGISMEDGMAMLVSFQNGAHLANERKKLVDGIQQSHTQTGQTMMRMRTKTRKENVRTASLVLLEEAKREKRESME